MNELPQSATDTMNPHDLTGSVAPDVAPDPAPDPASDRAPDVAPDLTPDEQPSPRLAEDPPAPTGQVQRAAGCVPWRRHKGKLLVAVIHRQRYDDWSWPKGKLDAGEDWPVAAAREVLEETGLTVRLGAPLPSSTYPIQEPTGLTVLKEVRYWAAAVTGGDGRLRHEVDKVAWLSPRKAAARLTYDRDREQLEALVAAEDARQLRAWPLLVVRHAKAVPRKQWSKVDWRRPLDERGFRQAAALVPVLHAYGVEDVITSSATRCVDSVKPYARSRGLTLRSTVVLSEEGFEENPGPAIKQLRGMLKQGRPTALCSHGPVLQPLFDLLSRLADPASPAREALDRAAAENLDKGEVLISHVAGTGKGAKVVAVERHPSLL